MREIDRRRQMRTASLTHNFFSWPYQVVLSSRPHLALIRLFGRGWVGTQPEACCGAPSHSVTLHNWLNHFWLQAETPGLRLPASHAGICINHFITPTHFCSTMWLLLLIFTDAFCAENFWLTAWSRINKQHLFEIPRKLPNLILLKKVRGYNN